MFGLVALLSLPTLGFGLMADDHVHRLVIQSWLGDAELPPLLETEVRHPLLDTFVFFRGDPELAHLEEERGLLPWWAAPDLKAAFFRPLTVVTHLVDHVLWPDTYWLMHLHSGLWMGLGLLLALWLFRSIHGSGPVAVLAFVLFAVEDAHGASVAWIANRNALIALVFGLLALLAHHRWRARGWWPGLPLGTLSFALGLLAGEAALATGGYLLAHALFLDRRARSRIAALACLLPHGLVLLAWAAVYRALEYGTAGADTYVSPTSAGFVRAVFERVPILLSAQWFQLPSDLWIGIPRWGQLAFSVLGAALVALLLRAWLPLLRARAEARFWSLGMVLATVPICASFPMDRLLMFVGLGAAGLLATWAGERGRLDPDPDTRRPGRLLTALLVLHLVTGPLLFPLKASGMWAAAQVFQAASDALPMDPGVTEQDLVFVNSVSMLTSYPAILRAHAGEPLPRSLLILGHIRSTLDYTRRDETSVAVRAEGGFLATPTEALLRGRQPPFEVGQRFRRGPMVVTVEAVTPDGRPDRVLATFDRPLEDPSLVWLVWADGELRAFDLPAPGETTRVEATWPVLGF